MPGAEQPHFDDRTDFVGYGEQNLGGTDGGFQFCATETRGETDYGAQPPKRRSGTLPGGLCHYGTDGIDRQVFTATGDRPPDYYRNGIPEFCRKWPAGQNNTGQPLRPHLLGRAGHADPD